MQGLPFDMGDGDGASKGVTLVVLNKHDGKRSYHFGVRNFSRAVGDRPNWKIALMAFGALFPITRSPGASFGNEIFRFFPPLRTV